MTENATTPPTAEGTPAPAPPPPCPSGDPLDEGRALELEQRLESLTSRIEAEASRLGELTRQNVTLSVGNRLDAIADRLPFAFRRAIEPVIVHLEANPSPGVLKLSQGGKSIETSAAAALFLALEQLPRRPADLGQEIAAEDDPNGPRAADRRSAEQRRLDLDLGISDEERLELEQKYPTAFGEEG